MKNRATIQSLPRLLREAKKVAVIAAAGPSGAFAVKAASATIPSGSPEATRRAFNKRFLLDLVEDCRADEVIE